jgi:CheY-like chemotaxis protein
MVDSRIMVVDDEERTRTFICDSLTTLGITDRAIGVSSAEEALIEADRSPIDLVISDIRMPGLNGLDLARQLHQTHPNTRVILITGYSTRDIERTAGSLAVEALLKKPFGLDTLASTVQTALQAAHSTSTRVAQWTSAEVKQQLTTLQRDSGAGWIGLIDAAGSIVLDTGPIEAFSSVAETINQRGWLLLNRSSHPLNGATFTYMEEPACDVYLTNITREYSLVLIYDRRWQTSRIGAVWLSARQTANQLAQKLGQPLTLHFAQPGSPLKPLKISAPPFEP